ncbi:uncharacterized protein LOC133800105 [Humulus lupulus]|uniref:uncharacterized protein LOC133800105 n=1 Tax=Humulus lupulus TaxID=3486 RepID=UPI002B4184B5|nr:uncharacterized protein LOC133800105 [Humulus lupulus]
MDSEDVFEHYRAVAASSGQKKDNKRDRGESSKTASKKARTNDPPATAPSKENSPPPTPLEQPASTPADQQPSPKAYSRETLHTQPEGSLPSLVVSFSICLQGLLTKTAGWCRAGALVSRGRNFDSRLAKAKQTLEAKNNELAKHNGELLGENTKLSKRKDELLEDKATLNKELLKTQDTLKKANESREKFRESTKLNYQLAIFL